MSRLKVLEWNINMRSQNKEIPEWVITEIGRKEADVIVLVEYKNGINNDELIGSYLKNNVGEYHIEYYDGYEDLNYGNNDKGNGVLIALRKRCFTEIAMVKHQDIDNDNHPNWLQVRAKLKNNNQVIDIIGVRVRVGLSNNERIELENRITQFKTFLDELNTLELNSKQVIIGDFNFGPHMTEYKPKYKVNWQEFIYMIREKEYLKRLYYSPYSPTGTSYKERKLDWLVTKGIEIKESSEYNQLDWSFGVHNTKKYVSGYNVPEGYFIRTDSGYPDHAMFTVELSI